MKIFGIVGAFFGVILLFAAMPTFMGSLDEVKVDPVTQAFETVTTGVGELTADVVLTQDLYGNRTTSVNTVTSDNVLDTPVASTYASATNTLTVSGLVASDTRTITVNYNVDALSDWTMMSMLIGWAPALFVIGVFALIGGTIFAATRHGAG